MCQGPFLFAVRGLRLFRPVFLDDQIDTAADQRAEWNRCAAGDFPQFGEPLGIDIKTGFCLPRLAWHGSSLPAVASRVSFSVTTQTREKLISWIPGPFAIRFPLGTPTSTAPVW